MNNALITGSQGYGTPNEHSDIDLVVMMSRTDILTLQKFADGVDRGVPKTREESDPGPETINGLVASLRFGGLNLICVSDPLQFEVWRRGTRALERWGGEVTREKAVEFFQSLQKWAGLQSDEPQPEHR